MRTIEKSPLEHHSNICSSQALLKMCKMSEPNSKGKQGITQPESISSETLINERDFNSGPQMFLMLLPLDGRDYVLPLEYRLHLVACF